MAETLKPMANVDYKAMVESGELICGADTAAVIVYGKKNGQNVRHELTFSSSLHEAIRHLPWVGNGSLQYSRKPANYSCQDADDWRDERNWCNCAGTASESRKRSSG